MNGDISLAIVAGSGIDLTPLLDAVTREESFGEIPGLPSAGVQGHGGRFIHGRSGDLRLVLQCGRLHFYEGVDYSTVVRPVDVLKGYGIRTVLFTNAAGGLRREMSLGDLVSIKVIHPWPYERWPEQPKDISTDFMVRGCLHAGDYMWCHGPSYETRAEIGVLQGLGGAVVGMSTAPEVHRCRELGIKTGVISCVTNNCHQPHELTHDEVVGVASKASSRIVALIREALPQLIDE